MPAPLGNDFWKLRSKHGRDKLFATPELMWEAACEYFEWVKEHPWIKNDFIRSGDSAGQIVELPTERPYTLEALCIFLDVNLHYFNDFVIGLEGKTDKISKDFSYVIARIREIINNQQFEGGMVGAFNANLTARKLGIEQSLINNNISSLNITVQDKETAEELNKLTQKK